MKYHKIRILYAKNRPISPETSREILKKISKISHKLIIKKLREIKTQVVNTTSTTLSTNS